MPLLVVEVEYLSVDLKKSRWFLQTIKTDPRTLSNFNVFATAFFANNNNYHKNKPWKMLPNLFFFLRF